MEGQMRSCKRDHLLREAKYLFLSSTASSPFHLTKRPRFLPNNASSSALHSALSSLSVQVLSSARTSPETRSNLLMRTGSVVLYSLANTDSNSASSPRERSFEGRESFCCCAACGWMRLLTMSSKFLTSLVNSILILRRAHLPHLNQSIIQRCMQSGTDGFDF